VEKIMFEKKSFLLSMPLAFFVLSCFSGNDNLPLDAPSSSSIESLSSSSSEETPLVSSSSEETLLVSSSSEAQSDKIPFEMIGLTPGSDVSEINFNWYSDSEEYYGKSIVRIFGSNDNIISTTSSGNTGSAVTGKFYHKVTVKGLTAGTSYKYSVSSDSIVWSNKYDYKVPAAGALRFALIADPQITTGMQDALSKYPVPRTTTAAGWAETLGKVVAANISFILSAGDQVDNGMETEYALFYAPAPLRNYPLAPLVGNNDLSCSFMYHFNLPNEQNRASYPESGCKTSNGIFIENVANYYYIYNNVLFVGLNTGAPIPTNMGEAYPYITKFSNTIKAAKAANAGKYDWLVVLHHKPTNSIAGHARDADVTSFVEAGFQELMTREGVDLVIGGHDHIYVRSKLMKDDHPSTDGKGTIYLVISTASGGKYYDINPNSEVTTVYPYFNQEMSTGGYLPESVETYSQLYRPEYSIVDVNGRSMTIKTYTINRDVPHDEFTFSPTLAK
jgi:hypothetical protein